jgi:hypothetical protein
VRITALVSLLALMGAGCSLASNEGYRSITTTTTTSTTTTFAAPPLPGPMPVGGGDPSTDAPPSVPAKPRTQSEYDAFTTIAKQLDAEVIPGRQDAAIRAALLCNDVEAWKSMIGTDLDAFPTDLALIRAYCPGTEAQYRG